MDKSTAIPANPEEQIILFRIVQEALNNVIKHANADNISITLSNGSANFMISIADDGKGFNMEGKKDGVGLMNMKHRASLLGGQLVMRSSPKGSEVTIKLPNKLVNEN